MKVEGQDPAKGSVVPPSLPNLFIPPGGFFRLQCWTWDVGVRVRVRWSVRSPGGLISEGEVAALSVVPYTIFNATCAAPTGSLALCSATVDGGTGAGSNSWVRFSLHGTSNPNSPVLANILSGYGGQSYSPSWPFGVVATPFSESGTNPIYVPGVVPVGTDVADAGAPFQIKPLRAANYLFVTSAALGARTVQFSFTSAGILAYAVAGQAAIGPGSVVDFLLADFSAIPAATATAQYVSLPPLDMVPAMSFNTTTTGLDVGDTWSFTGARGSIYPAS